MTAYEVFIDAARTNGRTVIERDGERASVQCPAHDDGNPSLSVGPRKDGKGVVIHCHAGCTPRAVLGAIGLTETDLFDEPKMRDAYSTTNTYVYADGRRVHRKPDKSFPQSGNKTGKSLFRAEKIVDACLVYVCEGEKDVLAVEAIGGTAVCSAMGAGKARLADWSPLADLDVIVVADKDGPGRKHAAEIHALLSSVARSVRIVEAAAGKDAADHIAAGHGLHELVPVDIIADEPPPLDEPDEPSLDDSSRFFGRDGLRVRDLAHATMRSVVCGFSDIDERFYTYNDGVWAPNRGQIETEITQLLGNRYRGAHCRNAMELIRYSPRTARINRDPQPKHINVPNGMVTWADGELHPHSPDYCSTVQLPVEYHPDATCPSFDQFLAAVLPEDCYEPTDDSPGFIWELIGYTLYSGNPLHIAVLLYGKGRNGKGTLIRTLKRLLGDRNCSTATLHELAENRFRTATLLGKLANLAGDLDSRWLESTAMFKAITGGDTIQGEHKYGAAFDFQPWALPFYSTNKAFGSSDSSEGWVARWVVVPFPTSFLGREDRHLDARLQTDTELTGILRRGIQALPALMKRGRLPEPESVRQAKAGFITASDAVRSWLDERCVLDFDAWTPRTDLYRAYVNRVDGDGSKRLSSHEFYNRIDQVNTLRAAKRGGERGFVGIRLAGPSDSYEGQLGAAGADSPTPYRPHGGKGREPAPAAPHGNGAHQNGATNGTHLNGQCIDGCGNPHSPGKRRCDSCDRIHTTLMAGYDR